MTRRPTVLLPLFLPFLLSAATGGPDQYGYIWKDSNEPDGPVFDWIDITTTGIPVLGLADDNVVGPFVMSTNMPFYWYSQKKIWIGSNGYIAFNSVNIASPFPTIPLAGGANDYIAALTSDLNFAGVGNPAQCFVYDNVDTTIISYINVPFWSSVAPSYTGSNTFQIILSKADSTITIQYQQQTGLTQNNDLLVGIESITGDIGLQHSADVYPVANYAVRFYAPVTPLLDITDGAVDWLTEEGSRGLTLKRNGAPFTMTMHVLNTGNQDLSNILAVGEVLNPSNQVVATDQTTIAQLGPGVDTSITFPTTYTFPLAGAYRFRGTISNIPNELVSSNNQRLQEVQVYDTTSAVLNVDWAGASDDGVGIGWSGGNGGVGAYLEAPYHPCMVAATTVRITSNLGPSDFTMKVYDDDGTDGGPGTLLDSVLVPAIDGAAGDHTYPLANPFLWTDGGLYVQWYMQGQNVNIAQDIVAPFSLHTYEVLDGVWAEYRDRETSDWHLGLQVTQLPVYDAGCVGYFGVVPGLTVSQPLSVRAWVKNFGNQAISGFPVHYRFANDPVVTETFTTSLQPGDSSLFTFTQQLLPLNTMSGDLCTWSAEPNDADALNDTICVNIDLVAGVNEVREAIIRVAPNPASDELVISGTQGSGAHLTLVDLAGKQIAKWDLAMRDRNTIDIRSVAQGTYLYQVADGPFILTGKLIITR
ncbi:MAG: T9SS type A sorting domain-containing protein [Flavobacteriales bacterium]|nr:T9SS type A sorting domain-containing protein [Flavobacteriales bacterium]MCB9166279.1 T9SS type A sorting domain-containing protein [Flavobacteriales bacterium]